jgi:hypothetical protein
VDQHLLLALVAPRPLLVSDGDEDGWANPEGAEEAVKLATPVFEFLKGVAPVWSLREGGHEVNSGDWERFLEFKDPYLE